jgi:hypothetical protein
MGPGDVSWSAADINIKIFYEEVNGVLSFNFCLEFSFFINNKRIDVSIHYIYIDIEYFSTISYGVSVSISN